MSTPSSPSKDVPADDKVVLKVLLNCEEIKSLAEKQVYFQSLPTTPLEVKKKIEEDFSIPSCVQTLHYQSMTLKDSDQLQRTHFRSGDTFTVDYPIEGDCEKVRNAIKWLKELHEVLKSMDERNEVSNILKFGDLILDGQSFRECGLSYALFSPWTNKRKLMNKYYFHQEGGLDMLIKIYSILIRKEWDTLDGFYREYLVYLEYICATAICRYTASLPLCRQVFMLGGMEMCAKTLIRKQLQEDDGLGPLIHDTLNSALLALCK